MNLPYTDLSRVAVDAATRLSKLSLDSTERLLALQLEFAKESLTEAARSAQTVAGAKDVEELLALRALAAQNAMERLVGYSRSLYEVASEAQSKLGQLAEERMAGFQKAVSDTVDQASKSAPAGSEAAMAAVKQTLAATTAAYDTMAKAVRGATSYADAGMKAAAKPRAKNAKKR